VTRRQRCYVVVAQRSGKVWMLHAIGVCGAFSQARRLADAEQQIREAIASVLHVSETSFLVDVDVRGRLTLPRPPVAHARSGRLGRFRWKPAPPWQSL
jgi:hypothetical protein